MDRSHWDFWDTLISGIAALNYSDLLPVKLQLFDGSHIILLREDEMFGDIPDVASIAWSVRWIYSNYFIWKKPVAMINSYLLYCRYRSLNITVIDFIFMVITKWPTHILLNTGITNHTAKHECCYIWFIGLCGSQHGARWRLTAWLQKLCPIAVWGGKHPRPWAFDPIDWVCWG